jgi:hypothetical protein
MLWTGFKEGGWGGLCGSCLCVSVVCARPAVASGAEGNAEPSLVVGMSTLLLLQPWPCTKGLFAEFRVVFLDVQFAPAIGVAHQAVHSCSV